MADRIVFKVEGAIVGGFSVEGYMYGEITMERHRLAYEHKIELSDVKVFQVENGIESEIGTHRLAAVEQLERTHCLDLKDYPQ